MEDMKEYMHNGQKVIYQTISDDSFLSHLSKAGIVPEELPLLDNRVFKYTKDGVTRYACVYAANVPEMYLEKIYITESLPEDGFLELMSDISDQVKGEEPKAIKSRLSLAVQEAEREAHEFIKKRYPDKEMEWYFVGYPEDVQKEFHTARKLALNFKGYHLEDVEQISAPDVDMEAVKEMLK